MLPSGDGSFFNALFMDKYFKKEGIIMPSLARMIENTVRFMFVLKTTKQEENL